MKQLTPEQIDYIETNISIFGINSKATEEERLAIYALHNAITGQFRKPNSCGRCWRNVKQVVYKQYLKQKQ